MAWNGALPNIRAWPDAAGIGSIALTILAGYLVFPDDLALLARILATSLLVVSLDLLVGFCGIITLGQAALFGAGAYAAGIAAVRGLSEPFSLLAIGAAAGGLTGLVSGAIILRAHGLAQLVLSIAFAQLLAETANKASWLTGGSDGLSGIAPAPLFGEFRFDLLGRTGYLFSAAVLIAVLAVLRAIAGSPFGLLCRGIRADPVRVRAMGVSVYPALLKMYGISGIVAGIGGALSAITTQVVGLDSVGFDLSASALVMLVLGGAGSLYGALLGTVTFMLFQHFVSAENPFHWLTLVGVLLIAVVLIAPRGLAGAARTIASRLVARRHPQASR